MDIKFKDIGMWVLWVPVRLAVQRLPLKAVYSLAAATGWLYYAVASGKRKKVAEELKANLGERYSGPELGRIVRRSFDMYVKMYFEILLLGSLTAESTGRMVSYEGLENLDNALNKGKGVILLISHSGSFMMVLPALGFKGYLVNQLSRPPVILIKSHNLAHDIKVKDLSVLPVNFLRSDKSLKSAITAIKKNEILVIAFDGREGNTWMNVELFGRTATFAPGPVRIASMTGATILPTFIIRKDDDTQTLVVGKPFDLELQEDNPDFIVHNLQRLARIFEEHVLTHPDHYGLMFQITKERAVRGHDRALFVEE